MITTEDKRRICARAFFQDNRDQYEDYHEAAAEFLSGQNVSDAFVDTVVESLLKPKSGHFVVICGEGHVATVRDGDFFFSPRTELSREEGEAIEENNAILANDYPELNEIELLQKMGWRVVHSPDSTPEADK